MKRKLAPHSSSFQEKPRCKVLQIATPCLPLMIGSGGFVVDVLNIRLQKRLMQPLDSGAIPKCFISCLLVYAQFLRQRRLELLTYEGERSSTNFTISPTFSADLFLAFCSPCAGQYLPYSFVNSIIAFRFSGFTSSVELLCLIPTQPQN